MILNHEICHGLQNKSHRRIVALSCWMTLWCVWLVVVSRKHISFWECEYIRIHLNSLNLFIKQAGSMALSCVTGWDFCCISKSFFCNLHFSLPNDISFYALKISTSVLHLRLVMYYIDWQKYVSWDFDVVWFFVWFVIRYISL